MLLQTQQKNQNKTRFLSITSKILFLTQKVCQTVHPATVMDHMETNNINEIKICSKLSLPGLVRFCSTVLEQFKG